MQVTNLLHVSFSLVLGMRGGVEPRNLKWGTWNCVRMKTVTSICAIKERDKPKNVGGSDPKDIRKFKPKVWNNAENKTRCPVEA